METDFYRFLIVFATAYGYIIFNWVIRNLVLVKKGGLLNYPFSDDTVFSRGDETTGSIPNT